MPGRMSAIKGLSGPVVLIPSFVDPGPTQKLERLAVHFRLSRYSGRSDLVPRPRTAMLGCDFELHGVVLRLLGRTTRAAGFHHHSQRHGICVAARGDDAEWKP
jgi:hypothetical protein